VKGQVQLNNIGFILFQRWTSSDFLQKNKTLRASIKFNKSFSTSVAKMESLKVAIIGQSQFAAEVYKKIKENGHEVKKQVWLN